MENYDCTNDVLKHRERVAYWLKWLTVEVLEYRARVHDESKLHSPEKEIFDEFTPKLKTLEFGSDEYKAALEKMGEGLKHHYKVNPHHPESHSRGVDGMTIWDLVEGSCSEQVITDQFSDETRRDAFMVHSQFVDGGIA